MARIAYKALLCRTIRSVHGVNARWLAVTRVQKVAGERVVWEGEVDTFELIRHSQAKHCYAWSIEAGNMTAVLTALKVPPVVSPQAAVNEAYIQGKLDPSRHLLQKVSLFSPGSSHP